MSPHAPFIDVPTAIEEIRNGRMIVVVDDEDRENEGDLTLAAEEVTPEAINFMAKHGRGLVCLAMTEERLDHLRIGPMTSENTSQYGTAFCAAIDARSGPATPGPHVPPPRPQGSSPRAGRPNRSLRRSSKASRHGPRGNHLRN